MNKLLLDKYGIKIVPEEFNIPKRVYMTYPVGGLTLELSENIICMKRMNPGWEFHLYDDLEAGEFIHKTFGENCYKLFKSINPNYGPARADLFRYLVLYVNGGIYLDIKSSSNHPLNDLILDGGAYVLAQWDNKINELHHKWGEHDELSSIPGGEYIQWFIASPKGSLFLLEVIGSVLNNLVNYDPFLFGVGKIGCLRATGPIAYTLAISRILQSRPFLLVRNYKELGLVYSIFEKDGITGQNKNIHGAHYSQQMNPIVGGRFCFINLRWQLFLLARRFQNAIKRLH